MNDERKVPTAWSAGLLLAGAVGATAGFLALDESLELHERLGPAGTALVGQSLHFAWVVPGAVAGAVVGAVLLLRLRRQPVLVRRRLVLAGATYLTGALLLETASGVVLRHGGPREPYIAVTAFEELLEMVGASLLLGTVLAVPRRSAKRTSRQRGPDDSTRRLPVPPRSLELPALASRAPSLERSTSAT